MTNLVLDAYVWVEYLEGSNERVKGFLEKNEMLFTNVLTIAEVVSKAKRKNLNPKIALNAIYSLSRVFNIDVNFSNEAGLLHAEIRKKIKDFGLADAFVLLTARKLNGKVLTGDHHFKGFKEAILI